MSSLERAEQRADVRLMDVSSVTSMMSGLQQAQTRSQVDTAVAKTAMDAQRQTGEAMVSMLRGAAETGKSMYNSAGRLDTSA